MRPDFKVGLTDQAGNTFVPCIYTRIEPYGPQGYAIVRDHKKTGYINRKGEEAIPCSYQEVSPVAEDGTVQVMTEKGFVIRIRLKRPN